MESIKQKIAKLVLKQPQKIIKKKMSKFNFNPDDLKVLADKFGKVFDEMLESDYYSINRYIPDMIGNLNSRYDTENYYYDILLPGYKKESIKVTIEENSGQIATTQLMEFSIRIKAETYVNTGKTDASMVYDKSQFKIKPFSKTIELPKNATKEISAAYEDGILKLTVKKFVNKPKTTEVKID